MSDRNPSRPAAGRWVLVGILMAFVALSVAFMSTGFTQGIWILLPLFLIFAPLVGPARGAFGLLLFPFLCHWCLLLCFLIDESESLVWLLLLTGVLGAMLGFVGVFSDESRERKVVSFFTCSICVASVAFVIYSFYVASLQAADWFIETSARAILVPAEVMQDASAVVVAEKVGGPEFAKGMAEHVTKERKKGLIPPQPKPVHQKECRRLERFWTALQVAVFLLVLGVVLEQVNSWRTPKAESDRKEREESEREPPIDYQI